MNKPNATSDKVIAWAVHIFTASGMIVGFKALVAACSGKIYESVLWLLVSILIDGVDGTFARKFRVKEVLPRVDGKMIDAAVDFVNYVITPALIFFEARLVPEAFLFPAVAGIIYASLYHIGNTEQLTPDNRIKGFPAWWNLVIYYLLVLGLNTWINLLITILFIILHFVPVKFIYLSRLKKNIMPVVVAVAVLVTANAVILFQYPHGGYPVKIVGVIPLVFLLVLGSYKDNLFPFRSLSKGSLKQKSGRL